MAPLRHLAWLPAGALLAFVVAALFGNWTALAVDLYYLIYFLVMTAFFVTYVLKTKLRVRAIVMPRLLWALAVGAAIGVVMLFNVLSHPGTPRLGGAALAWSILWRGVVYGVVDGILLFAFPWVVTWRALRAESGGIQRKLTAAACAWVAVLFVTTVYHLGYADFRSSKVIQPNVGSAISSLATLGTANPVGSVVAHVLLHVTAVVHCPESDLYLPPHRGGGLSSD